MSYRLIFSSLVAALLMAQTIAPAYADPGGRRGHGFDGHPGRGPGGYGPPGQRKKMTNQYRPQDFDNMIIRNNGFDDNENLVPMIQDPRFFSGLRRKVGQGALTRTQAMELMERRAHANALEARLRSGGLSAAERAQLHERLERHNRKFSRYGF